MHTTERSCKRSACTCTSPTSLLPCCLLLNSKSGAPFAIIVNLIIPGNPMLALVATFITERHPNDALGPTAPANPMSEPHDWEPFDFVLHKWVVWKVWGVWEVWQAMCAALSYKESCSRDRQACVHPCPARGHHRLQMVCNWQLLL